MTRQELISLIEQEGKAVYSFCCMLTGNQGEAEELYQEAMLSAVEHCRDIDSSQNPKGYLIGIVVRLHRDSRRKYARRQRIAPMGQLKEEMEAVLRDEMPDIEEQMVVREGYTLVRQEVRALPEKLRTTVLLYYTAELSVEEIALRLHIPQGTVKSRLHKARNVLRQRLEEYGYEEI